MTSWDIRNYWRPAAIALFGLSFDSAENEAKLYHLDEMLGIKEYSKYMRRPVTQDYPMSDELKNLLMLLVGPHGKTILKVYRIKKGLEP